MKNIKKIILSLSALTLCCVASGSVLTAVTASAETANTVSTVNFQMVSGASIRLDSNTEDDKDENGIRYQITMPDAEYKALERNSAYTNVSYGILIAPSDYVEKYGELNKANVFGTNAVYDWAVKNEDGEWIYNGSKTRIMNFESDTLSPWSKDETMRTYFSSIVNLNENNISRQFVGVGYIKYSTTTGTDYVFATAKDNARSMSQVARLMYQTTDSEIPQNVKDTVKKTYIDDVYGKSFGFNSASDAYLSENDKAASVVTDGDAKGVKIKVSQLRPLGSSQMVNKDLRIDLGGEYQFKDIKQIVIKYRITESNNSGWWRCFFNDNTAEGQQIVKGTGVTFSTETGRQSEVMSSYATLTIDPTVANSKTGLSNGDYLYAINIGYRDQVDREMTMIIDSVELKVNVFDESDLEFNGEDALGVVMEGQNTSIVDLGNGNKALQADLSQWYSGGTRCNLKINLGGKYQVKDIAKVEISYRVSSVKVSSSGMYWNIHLNAPGDYTSVNYANRLTGLGSTTFVTTTGFNKITLTDAGAAGSSLTGNTVGGTLLNQDSYLENLFFCVNGSGDSNVATIQIDYIRIVLK